MTGKLDDFVIAGGSSTTYPLSASGASSQTGLVVKFDLALRTRAWARIVVGQSNSVKLFHGLALSPDGSKVAGYATTDAAALELGSAVGLLFFLTTADGGAFGTPYQILHTNND